MSNQSVSSLSTAIKELSPLRLAKLQSLNNRYLLIRCREGRHISVLMVISTLVQSISAVPTNIRMKLALIKDSRTS